MFDPQRNFDAFASSLRRAGFEVIPHSAPWYPDYINGRLGGKYQLYLAGWIADFPDPDNFFHDFRRYQPMFGFRNRKLFKLVDPRRRGDEPGKASAPLRAAPAGG